MSCIDWSQVLEVAGTSHMSYGRKIDRKNWARVGEVPIFKSRRHIPSSWNTSVFTESPCHMPR